MFPSAEDVRRAAKVALIVRAARKSNPMPGRQVISREGEHEYGLPIGSTIPPGTRRLPKVEQDRLRLLRRESPEKFAQYMSMRRRGDTHHAALLTIGNPRSATPPKKAVPRKSAPRTVEGAMRQRQVAQDVAEARERGAAARLKSESARVDPHSGDTYEVRKGAKPGQWHVIQTTKDGTEHHLATAPGGSTTFKTKTAAVAGRDRALASRAATAPAKKAAHRAPKAEQATAPSFSSAASGPAALDATRYRPATPLEQGALDSYGGEGPHSYAWTNQYLRTGMAPTPPSNPEHINAVVAGLDQAMADSPGASADLVVYRQTSNEMFGLSNDEWFGPGWQSGFSEPPPSAVASLVGREFTDPAFVSTSVRPSDGGVSSRITMRILVPKGTKALSYHDAAAEARNRASGFTARTPYGDAGAGGLDPDEVLLDRGLRFRVVADSGFATGYSGRPDPNRGRQIDVIVLPRTSSPAKAVKASPAKVAKATPAAATRPETPRLRALREGLGPTDANAYARWEKAHPGASVAEWQAQRRAREAAAAAPKPAKKATPAKATPAKATPAKIAPAPTQPSVIDENVPLQRDPEGDNMRMHGDSLTMGLAQAYARSGRNGSANRMMDLRRRSTTSGPDGITPQQTVDELRTIRAQEQDPVFQRRLDRAIEGIDAPMTPLPDLPANTPPAARQLIEDLHAIPYARKDNGDPMGGGSIRGASLVDQLADVYRDAAAGRRDDAGRSPAERIRSILRGQTHEVNEAAFRIWALERRLDTVDGRASPLTDELRRWERGQLGPA